MQPADPSGSLPAFAPMLLHRDGIAAIDFYKKAFGAEELRRWSNDDGSIHVAELSLDGAIFHIREVNPSRGHFSALEIQGVTTLIGLLVTDPHALATRAIAAGATEISPVTDYEYGWRQGILKDPFGHTWLIEKRI
jgi:PhnB protein